jgi:branched-chain amino acid transport system substrate-binding protein
MKGELQAAGGSDAGMDAAPLGTTDFSSLILKMRQAKPDVIVLGIAGLDLAAFLKQYEEFGLRTPLAAIALGDEELWSLQSSPVLVTGKYWHFNNPDNTPEERALNEAVMKATGHPATLGAVTGWVSTRMLLAGIENAKSLEPLAIVRGLETARPSGVRGHYREWDHQMIWQPLVVQLREKVTNKFDPLVVVSKPLPPAELEALYGSRQASACKMNA